MRLTSAVLALIAFLYVPSVVAEKDVKAVAGSQRAALAKCVHEVNQAGVAAQDRGKRVSECVAENSQPDPMGLEIKDCVEKARPHRGTPEWTSYIQPCMQAVSEKYNKK